MKELLGGEQRDPVRDMREEANKLAAFVSLAQNALKEVAQKHGIEEARQDSISRRIAEAVLYAKQDATGNRRALLAHEATTAVQNALREEDNSEGNDERAVQIAEEYSTVLVEHLAGLRLDA